MAVNDIFKKVPVEIPNKSGFDCSHENVFTATCGTLTPAMCDLMLPGDTISLGVGSEIQLPPMATDFYGRVKGHFEAFFVPCRILYGGWQNFMTHPVSGDIYPSDAITAQKCKYLPALQIPLANVGLGSLADYLGYQVDPSTSASVVTVYNPLRFLAYHKIWDSFYRDSRIQTSAFAEILSTTVVANSSFYQLPHVTDYDSSARALSGTSLQCADGVYAYALRQRNFGRDYFTNMTPQPQAGSQSSLAFTVDTSTGEGSFTIASLRAANSLQQWLERNNIAGYRYGDQIKAHFGVYPNDAALDRPIYLGREIVDVYNKSVFQNNGEQSATTTQNPFSSVGAKYASPLGVGNGKLVDKFTATEHGYIFVMFSLVPDAIYDGGIEREFFYNTVGDFPFPLLAGVGDQPVTRKELLSYASSAVDDDTIGYTQRYANHKYMRDRVHGLLRGSGSLDSFALTRTFGAGVTLGTSLLEIPTTYLDDVTAVSGDASTYGCWVDAYFNYHKVSTLPAYSIPTLADLKNTHTEVIDNGGFRL